MNKPHIHANKSASTKVPHKHAELIKAWADGAAIQRYNKTLQQWRDCDFTMLDWNPVSDFRVKPAPKPDSVKIRKLTYNADIDCICIQGPGKDQVNGNIMFVFDGETGVLKDVQLLAKK